jgi:hypothetical protein
MATTALHQRISKLKGVSGLYWKKKVLKRLGSYSEKVRSIWFIKICYSLSMYLEDLIVEPFFFKRKKMLGFLDGIEYSRSRTMLAFFQKKRTMLAVLAACRLQLRSTNQSHKWNSSNQSAVECSSSFDQAQ